MADLRNMTLAEAEEFVQGELGEPRFRGEQMWRWAHEHGVSDFDAMTNVSKKVREGLGDKLELSTLEVAEVQTSLDGTRKMRMVTSDGRSIESVLIPDGDKMTQCISSQVGCALDCQFCATGRLGLTRHLSAGEIVDQVYRGRALLAEAEPGRRITNLVYMGMGEPLHNYKNVVKSLEILTHGLGANFSQRRITVSTVGLVPGIDKLAQEEVRPNLAVSLNASCDEVRDEVMPVNKRWNIEALLAALKRFPLERRRRITFEYVLLKGLTDRLEDADRLIRLLHGFRCKVNVIPWNPHPGAPYERPSDEAIAAFQNRLRNGGLACYLRTPRGDDIDAACGQLANRSNQAPVKLRVDRAKPSS